MALSIAIAIAALTIWVISLLKLLFSSRNPPSPPFLSNGVDGVRRNVLLVIAHPDDESMFFAPSILYLASRGHNVHILCMSTGNADGKGDVRQAEFSRACAILMVPLQQIKILDTPNLQDGFNNKWDHRAIATIVEEEVKAWGIDSLVSTGKFAREY